jgi:hypothetical protein
VPCGPHTPDIGGPSPCLVELRVDAIPAQPGFCAELQPRWPVACAQAGDTSVYIRQDPTDPGLLIEICTKTAAEHLTLTVTLDGHTLHPTRRPAGTAA